jgi:hypothetical protein
VAPLFVVVDHPSVYEDAGGLPIRDVARYGREALVFEDLVECFDLAVRPRMGSADRPLEEAPVGDSFEERVGEEALGVVGEEQPVERERSCLTIVVRCLEGLELVAGGGEEARGEAGKRIDAYESTKPLARLLSLPSTRLSGPDFPNLLGERTPGL